MKWLSAVLLVLALSGTLFAQGEQQFPFREGIEYRYDWSADLSSESLETNLLTSSAHLRGQLYVVSKIQDADQLAIYTFKNVSVSMQHGEKVEEKDWEFTELAKLSVNLLKPFQVAYQGGKVVGAAFSDNDVLWSTNFKRSIASLFQGQHRTSDSVYTDRELSLYGNCSFSYYVSNAKGQIVVQKETDFKSCDGSYGRWSRNIHRVPCSATYETQNMAGASSTTWYTMNAATGGHLELSNVRSTGSIFLNPFGNSYTSMKSDTKINFQLKKTRIQPNWPKSAVQGKEFSDRLRFVFGHPLDGANPLKVDLKAAQNLMLHGGSALPKQESLRRTILVDLFAVADILSSGSPDDKISLDKVALSKISNQLGSLDFGNLRALYQELTVTAGNQKYDTAKNLFLDLLMHSGSNPSVLLLQQLIRDKELDEMTAMRLIGFAAVYVKRPSEKLLKVFQAMMDIDIPNKKYGTFYNSAVLAFTGVAKKTCSGPNANYGNPCSANLISDLQKSFYNKIIASTKSSERGLYIHALRNLGYDAVLAEIVQLINESSDSADEDVQYLRVYAIHGLDQHKSDDKVYKLLLSLLADKVEKYPVRIAAATVLLEEPNEKILRNVHHVLRSEEDLHVRRFLTSSLHAIVVSRIPCLQHLKGLAKTIVDAESSKPNSAKNSAVLSLDVMELASTLGVQLNLKLTSGQFDDIPAFVDAKMTNFFQGFAYEPVSITMRLKNMKSYVMSLLNHTMRNEDLNQYRLQELAENLQFVARKQHDMSTDITATYHGMIVIFVHADHSFFAQSVDSFDKSVLEDAYQTVLNIQRYASLATVLYTLPNALGFPTSIELDMPSLISVQGTMMKPETTMNTFSSNVTAQLLCEMRADHSIVTHLPLGMSQSVARNAKAIYNLPFNGHVAAEMKPSKEIQLDLTYAIPDVNNPLEVSSLSRTTLNLQASDASQDVISKICPDCNPTVVVLDPSIDIKTETIVNVTYPPMGIEVQAQVFDCPVADIDAHARNAFNWMRNMFGGYRVPFTSHCGVRASVSQSRQFPVKEISSRLKIKYNLPDETETLMKWGKVAVKGDISMIGETDATLRSGKVDAVLEYRGAKQNVSMRLQVDEMPFLKLGKWMMCLKADGNMPTIETDWMDISGYEKPPSAYGSVDCTMGEVKDFNQCPADQIRIKANIKASAGDWVMDRRDQSLAWPYKQCKEERDSQIWAGGMTPQTYACYKSALDFTTLSKYETEVRIATGSVDMASWINSFNDVFRLTIVPHVTYEKTANNFMCNGNYSHVQMNVTVLPNPVNGKRMVEVNTTTSSFVQRQRIPLPASIPIVLQSTNVPSLAVLTYETSIFPTCTVTSQNIRSIDNATWPNTFSSCYSLISSDCGSAPLFAVFARRAAEGSAFPLAVKVDVGDQTIEIIPGLAGNESKFTVRANNAEVDAISKSYTLPEGRQRFYVFKVRYQAPHFIISSPAAGLFVQYSGSHVKVSPSMTHGNQHCGLCGNFNGEQNDEWISPKGCPLNSGNSLIASYTPDRTCFPAYRDVECNQ